VTFDADLEVRTAISVAAVGPQGSAHAVSFADTGGNVYSLDADTGQLRWKRHVDDHPAVRTVGKATVNELAEPFDMTQPSISKHLKVLERAGLISRGRAAQTRPCRLEAAPLKEIATWVGVYRNLWEESFDRLDAFLQSTKSTSTKGKRNGRKS
jgi:DNA-binding transcriptional ArsR family regulator